MSVTSTPTPRAGSDGTKHETPTSSGAPVGPGSLTWELFGDSRMALLGPRAAVLQNMLPSLGQGVEDHSVWFDETIARLQRSIPPIFRTVYGKEPESTGREVRDFHTGIKGKLPDGSPYHALNPDTYYWAHATFVEHMVVAADTFIRRLSLAEKDQIIAESVTWYERYGVSSNSITGGIPTTWAEFERYWDDALERRLVKHRVAAYGVGYATKGWPRPKQVPRPLWWLVKRPLNAVSSSLTIGGLPPRAREILDLPWDDDRERRYQRFARLCRAADHFLRRLPAHSLKAPIPARAIKGATR